MAIIKSNLAQLNSILHASATHGTQYEGNPRSHHGGMCEDGLTDGRTVPILIFPHSTSVELGIIKETFFSMINGVINEPK